MTKPTEEDFLKLDVRYLHKTGVLQHGNTRSLTWTRQKRDGVSEKRKTGEIGVVGLHENIEAARGDRANYVLLRYSISGKPVPNRRVSLEWQELAFKTRGGAPATRPWFRCPGCSARVACLFFPYSFHATERSLWACRSCQGLAYATQNLTPEWRLQRRVFKAFDAIGYEGSIVRYPEFPKHGDPLPGGVSWSKYLKKWLGGWHLWIEYQKALGASFEKKFPQIDLTPELLAELESHRPPRRGPGRPRRSSGESLAPGARCGAKTRAGTPCQCKPEAGKKRCKLHGGKSTGPKTGAGREAIRESNRRRRSGSNVEKG